MTELKPFILIGPGDHLKEEMEMLEYSNEDLAGIIGVTPKHISEIVNNKVSINLEFAKKLSVAVGGSPQYWVNLDINYRLALNDDKETSPIEKRKEIYKYMPVTEMVKRKWIKKTKKVNELENEIKKFWNISELDFSFMDDNLKLACRKFNRDTFNYYHAKTWQQMAYNLSKNITVPKFNKTKLLKLVENISEYTTNNNGISEFIEELNKAGIKFIVLKHLHQTYIDAGMFYDNKNPVIVYTGRYNRIDHFWFTIAHEIGHIIKHKDKIFIDNFSEIKDEKEIEADKFAQEKLKLDKVLKYFIENESYHSKTLIFEIADKFNLHPACVIGTLQFNKKISPKNFNKYKEKFFDKIDPKYNFIPQNIVKQNKPVDSYF